jgi:hypothetical protein
MRIKFFHWITRLLLLAFLAGVLPIHTTFNSVVAQEQDKKKKKKSSKKKKPSKKRNRRKRKIQLKQASMQREETLRPRRKTTKVPFLIIKKHIS